MSAWRYYRHSGLDPESSRVKKFFLSWIPNQVGNDGGRKGNPTSDQRGFTLAELVVTIVVLGLVVLGIGSLYYSMQITEVRSQHLDMAMRAARTKIEGLRNNGYNALTPDSTIDFGDELPADLPGDRTGRVAVSEPLPGLRRVDVTVQYTDYGKQQTVTLSSNIGVIGIGQGQ